MKSRYASNPDSIRALVRADSVHRDLYVSEEIFALEQEHFFANTWNYIGHDSQIPAAGDFVSVDLAGRPLLAVRQADGSVRVMMNRCAHKGARIVSTREGCAGKYFRCPYHAWVYRIDGSLHSTPLKKGYEGTGFEQCDAAKGLVQVRNVRVYRGFIFARLAEAGPDFESYFGDSLSSIDNMADRSPLGELEIAGAPLRFIHDCNWKMFVENLNDTMHPMVVHESSAGTAKSMWAGQPADAVKPMAIEQFVPFMSDYKFFEDMGVRVFANGHSFTGVNFSIHSNYRGIPAYEAAMNAAYGPERAADIVGMARHNTVYYPNLTIKGAIQAIRVVKPLSVNRTLVESWTFRLKGAPAELLQRTVMYNRLINSPFSVVGHDDLFAYRSIQAGLQADGNDWVNLQRNYEAEEAGKHDQVAIGTSELPIRNQYRAWAHYMTATL